MATPLFAQQSTELSNNVALPNLVDARVSNSNERARLVLDLTDTTLFALASLDEPKRIAVDVKALDIKLKDENITLSEGLISSISFEKIQKGRIRTWLVLSSFAMVQQAYILEPFDDQPARLVVDIVPTSSKIFLENAALDLAYSQTVAQNQHENLSKLDDYSNVPGDLNSKLSSRPLIIIDPGHGGVDGGAQSTTGHMEKNIVLNFAKTLQQVLIESDSFDVALTRTDDSFISLRDRVNLARQNKADLFISIHADSFEQEEVGGISIYVRDEEATDILDKILAENENKVDIIAGFTPPDVDKRAVSILVDLMRREMRRQAFMVAQNIVEQLKPSVRLRRFPVRKADFYVLHSPDVPSILIELGFLSNKRDIENLETKKWNERVAQSLARGVAVYFEANNDL